MPIHSIKVREPAGVAARVLWLLRWVMVLVIIWDQVGSPLHHHRHDSGVDAQWLSAADHAAPHAENEEHHLISHAVLAVRPQVGLNSLVVEDGSSDNSAYVGTPPAQLSLGTPSRLITGAEPPLPRSTHRSLPPAGRAPPLHT